MKSTPSEGKLSDKQSERYTVVYSQNFDGSRSMMEIHDNVNFVTCFEYERISGGSGDSGIGFSCMTDKEIRIAKDDSSRLLRTGE